MIPKKIHYFWFGGNEKPKSVVKCIDSWKKYCPDYEIIEWNETNFDVHCMPFVEQAYNAKKYAFVSDVARLIVVYEQGGIYMDTDVELLKPLDDLLKNKAYMSFENNEYVNSGQGFGSQAGVRFFKEHIDEYRDEVFIKEDGSFNMLGCPRVATRLLEKKGIELNGKEQIIDDVHIYPAEYFNPYDDATGVLSVTNNTYSIHWYSKTCNNRKKNVDKLMKCIHKLFGTEFVHNLAVKLGLRK